MRCRRVLFISVCALGLGLAACDSKVAFPGFDEKPGTEKPVPPPPGLPAEPVATPPSEQPVEPAPPTPELPKLPPEAPNTPETGEAENTDDEETDTPETGAPESGTPETDPSVTEPAETGTDTPSPEPSETPEETPVPVEPETPAEPTPAEPTQPEPTPPPAPTPTPPPPPQPVTPAFSYHAPGDLIPGSGQGSPDKTVYAPDMVFPIKDARAFSQSMVFLPGGFRYEGDLPGDECIPENYEYPWRDNFCERGRDPSFKSAACPAGSGVHLGQDIRVGDGATCQAMRRTYRNNTQGITSYKVVAAEDGVISNISTYTVSLRAGPRTYRYLHMNMRALQVSIGDTVSAGQHLGYVSKDFGFDSKGRRRPTTFHLHFTLKINTDDGSIFVPPYTSLVASYARREGAPGREIERNIAIASDALSYDPEEVFELSE